MTVCRISECEVSVHTRGFCEPHWREDYRQRNANWRKANPDYWRNRDSNKKKSADNKYNAKNREKRRLAEAKRRKAKANEIAAKRNSPEGRDKAVQDRARRAAMLAKVDHEDFSNAQLIEKYGSSCYLCGDPIDLTVSSRPGSPGWELGLHREHVIPISKGGGNTLENCRPAHAKCNLKKARYTLDEYLERYA